MFHGDGKKRSYKIYGKQSGNAENPYSQKESSKAIVYRMCRGVDGCYFKNEPVDNPCRNMAAVGVVFLLIVAVNRILRQKNRYGETRPEPDLRHCTGFL